MLFFLIILLGVFHRYMLLLQFRQTSPRYLMPAERVAVVLQVREHTDGRAVGAGGVLRTVRASEPRRSSG
jgi:hypothetical protein